MAMVSLKELTYNHFLNQLNQNSKGVKFSGNFMAFEIPLPNGGKTFKMLSDSEESLEKLLEEYTPVFDTDFMEHMYISKNKRTSLNRTFSLVVDVPYVVKDDVWVANFDSDNEVYQALLEAIENINNQIVFNDQGYKLFYKVKTPTKGGQIRHDSKMFQMLYINLSVDLMTDGRTGSMHKFFLAEWDDTGFSETDTYEIDMFDANPSHTANTYDFNATTDFYNKTYVTAGKFVKRLSCQYRNDSFIPDEIFDKLSDKTTKIGKVFYRLVWKKPNRTKTYKVKITNITLPIAHGDADVFTVTFEEAGEPLDE